MRPIRGGISGLSGIYGSNGGSSPPGDPFNRIIELDAADYSNGKILDASMVPPGGGDNINYWTETTNERTWERGANVGPVWGDEGYAFNNDEDSCLEVATPVSCGQERDLTVYFYGKIAGQVYLFGNNGASTLARIYVNSSAGMAFTDSTGLGVFGEELGETVPEDQLVLVRLRIYTTGQPDIKWTGLTNSLAAVDEGFDPATVALKYFLATSLAGSSPSEFNQSGAKIYAAAIWQWTDVTNRSTYEAAYETAHGGAPLGE